MIDWIVTSSVLILLVLLLRVVVKGRISPKLRYALWALVLVRLLVPGTLWESKASVMTPVAAQEAYQAVERMPRYIRTTPDGWTEVGYADGEVTSFSEEAARSEEPSLPGVAPLPALKKQMNVRNILLAVWLAGIAGTGAFLLAVNLRFDRRLKKNRRSLTQYRGRQVYVMEGLASPCLFGLFRPGIYLTPEVAEDEAKQAHVLAHEYTHFRQGDHIWAALRGVCLAVHWYNPLVWTAAAVSRRDCELSCDEGAVRLLGEECRADYGRTLVGLVAGRTTAVDLARCATTMTGGKSALKERIALLVKHPRTTAVMAVFVAAACLVFAVCTFTGAALEPPAEPDSPGYDYPRPEPEPAAKKSDPPAQQELPTRLFDVSVNSEDPIWLVAELPEVDIAAYYVPEANESWLRRGDTLQKIDDCLMVMPQAIGPELYFEDFDGDEELELVVIHYEAFGSGIAQQVLTIYEWDGELWRGVRHDPQWRIDQFNAERSYYFDEETGRAEIAFRDSDITLDLSALWEDGYWAAPPDYCGLSEMMTRYEIQGSMIYLTIGGELLTTNESGFLHGYVFDYTSPFYYDSDNGTTYLGYGWLESDFEWMPVADESRLTPVFREILRGFMEGNLNEIPGLTEADLANDFFAIADVNGDGRDELITQCNNGPTAAHAERVYDSSGNCIFDGYSGLVTYYDNGYATAGWSHNQGKAGDKLWPYTLSQYDGEKYVPVASVDGWDKQHGESDYSYRPGHEGPINFPEDVDQDGDGFVYYIITEEGGHAPAYGTPVDYAEWAEWAAVYLGGNAVQPLYVPLTEENIEIIG